MIISALLDLLFAVIQIPFNLLDIPDVPQLIWDNINVVHQYLSSGFRLCQYFFQEEIYTLFIGYLIFIVLAKPTIKLFIWIYNKLRGC